MDIFDLGRTIKSIRKQKQMLQADLAAKAGISRSTLIALEKGSLPELGVVKLCAVLAALDQTLTIGPASFRRPTLDDLRHDQDME
tara:strand:+ start:12565 stop:12819 length:255 start_codon:yes stop_codon:yes gene_type:complete